jgi:hypothetical protein
MTPPRDLGAERRARSDLRIPAAKRSTGWWIALPEHEGDLRDGVEGPPRLPGKALKDRKAGSTAAVESLESLPRSGRSSGSGRERPDRGNTGEEHQ